MRQFIRLADGVDVLPLLMSVQRQAEGVFGEVEKIGLYAEDWTGEYYAFPQIRPLLLNILHRVESGRLHSVTLLRVRDRLTLPALVDSSQATVLVGIGPESVMMICGEDQVTMQTGSIVFSPNAAELILSAGDGEAFALAIIYSPMP